jgi:tight adherence protein C
METIFVAIVLGVIAGAGVLVATLSLRPASTGNADLAERRLRAYEATAPLPVTEQELQQPFMDRIVRPAIKRFGRLVEQTMPDRSREKIRLRLQLAGRLNTVGPGDFIAWRYVLTVALTLAGLAIGLLTRNSLLLALGAALGASVGLYAPMLWLRSKVGQRRSEIQMELPDVIDALIVCVEAGLTFESAMEKVVEKYDHALSDELGRVLQETRLGRPRLEALTDMAARCGVEELNNFAQAVVQSEQLGAGIARILHIQSEEIRQRRLTIAQERGARASLKMLVPMIGCIFPTLWVILLGPAALLALDALGAR